MALSAQQQQDYADFLRRFEADPSSISGEEAARRYHELIGLASPEDAAVAQNQVLGQLPPESRRTLAQQFQDAHNDPNSPFDGYTFDNADRAAEPQSLGRMTFQAGQQDESMLGRIFNSPLGKMAMSAIVAYLARQVLGGQQSDEAGMERQAGGLDLGSILGALGGAQGGQSSGQAPGHTDAPAGEQPDLSVLLGGQGNTQGTSSEVGRILTSLGGEQPAKDEDDQEDKRS